MRTAIRPTSPNATAPKCETWIERMAHLSRNHRLYTTVWTEGYAEYDRLAARHEADIRVAARSIGVSFAAMVARISR